ncbi:hypothetical protein B0I35DRAFT_474856 [Stachybotrys elegans]|uniref:Uncharacterized protein n=1 Tax=Stachybotrys elegans TaxID=80388 RepID=A0A8K0T1F1_9HYPO|nr:hypothetical protein B0I35DRAFT_474856 [Stachybotrys elegans]
MLSFAPAPIFGSWDHRPAVPSPLSSSPIRASSPLSPIDRNTLPQRQIQSSPIQAPKFKFASRQTKPNPMMRRREDAQDSRRKTFLQSVRQKADDKAWQRRDVEGQLLRTSILENRLQLAQGAPSLTDADIEDAVAYEQGMTQQQDDDEVMADDMREDDELEAMIAAYEAERPIPQQRPPSPNWSDEEFDDAFDELLSQPSMLPQFHDFGYISPDSMDTSGDQR